MKCRSFKLIREDLESVEPVKSREKLLAALPVLVEALVKLAQMRRTIKAIAEAAADLNEACSEYALAHPAVFVNGKLITDGKGVRHGDVDVDGVLYHFACGFGKLVRTDGDNITQSFVEGLPEKWVKGKVEIDLTAINRLGVTDRELEAAGLVRSANNAWSLPETAEE